MASHADELGIQMRDQFMWHRRRGSQRSRTRRALGAPAVAGNVSALIAEMLEDRTLLSGVAEGGGESWADLLGANDSVAWLLPSDAVTWIANTSGDAESADVVVQVDAESSWQDFFHLSADADESVSIESQVLLVVKWSASESSDVGSVGVADAVETPFVQITIRSANDLLTAASMPQGFTLRNNAPAFQGSSASDIGQPTDDLTDHLIPVIAKAVDSSKSGGSNSVTVPVAITELASPTTNVGAEVQSEASWNSWSGVAPRRNKDVNDVELAGIGLGLELAWLRSDDVSRPAAKTSAQPAATSLANVPAKSDSVSISQPISFASLNSTDAVGSSDVVASTMTPVEGLQAAAAPVVAVIETLLASLDTAARALLALLTGSGGSSSPVAPIVQPILNSTQVALDPKRPRWALHDGLVDELAVYSLVLVNDQHFDLKDFGPASSAADPVVRIEFDVPPRHGQIAATEIPGEFRYSADPGFSGVDAALFRVTRASGQAVAGAVTVFVDLP